MSTQRSTTRETHILTELDDIILLAVEENGEIIGYLPYHRKERTIITITDEQLNRMFTKMVQDQQAHQDSTAAAG